MTMPSTLSEEISNKSSALLSLEKNRERLFCVYYTVKGQMFLDHEIVNLNAPPQITHVVIRPTHEQDSTLAIDGSHLVIEVFINAKSMDEAIERSRWFVDLIYICKSFLAGVPSNRPQPILVYDATPISEVRELAQIFYTHLGPARLVDFSQLTRLMDKMLKSKDSERLLRSMHWMRSAISAKDVLDMLSYGFIAFEAINPLLAEKLATSISVTTTIKCPKCCENSDRVAPGLGGVNHFFNNSNYSSFNSSTWREAKGIRNAIIHSFEPLNALASRAWKINASFIQALYQAISILLDGDAPERDFTDVASYTRSGELIECYTIKGWSVQINPLDTSTYPTQHPHFQHLNFKIDRSFDGTGPSTATFNRDAKPIGTFSHQRYATGVGGVSGITISEETPKETSEN